MEGFSKEKLKRIRLQLGLSQRDVPGVAQDTVSALESGRREPRPSTLKRLAQAYGVEVRDFFEESRGKATASPSSEAERAADEERRLLELVREQLSELNRIASQLEEVAVARTFDVVKFRKADEGLEDVHSAMMGALGELRKRGGSSATKSVADEVEATMTRLLIAQRASLEAARDVLRGDELAEHRRRKAVVQDGLDELPEKAANTGA